MRSPSISHEDKIAIQLLLEIEKNNKITKEELLSFVTPFRVAYLSVLAFILNKIKAVTFDTRESIISQLSIFGKCENQKIELFISGEDSLRKKDWLKRIDKKLEKLPLLDNKSKKLYKLAKAILAIPVYTSAEYNDFLSRYKARHNFATDLEQIFERDGSGILYLLDKSSYEFWFGEQVIEEMEANKTKRKELKRIRTLEKKSKANAKLSATKVIVAQAPSFISNDHLFLSPDDMDLLSQYHQNHCPGISFDPKFVIISLSLSANLDPSITLSELNKKEITIKQILDKFNSK